MLADLLAKARAPVPGGDDLAETVTAARRAAFGRLLDTTQPVDIPDVATASALTVDETEAAICWLAGVGAADRDDAGRILGVHGITLVPSAHQLRISERDFYTWCALDAVAIPFALEAPATAVTSCPTCGLRHELRLPAAAEDQEALVWFAIGVDCCDPARDFCSAANLFCHIDHLVSHHGDPTQWRGRPLTIAEAGAVGRVIWSDVAAQPPNDGSSDKTRGP